MADGEQKTPDIVLLKSETEAAAARVAERAMNDTWSGAAGLIGDVFGGLVGDRVKQWRTRNLVDALAKTKEHFERQGVSIEKAKSLHMGELYSIFEGASKTDDVDLSQMWAALLSNSMNPTNSASMDPIFVRLLESLSGLDARILNYNLQFHKASQEYHQSVEPLILAFNNMISESPEFIATQSEYRLKQDLFKRKATALRDEILDHCNETNISYSISNLLRLGLLYIPDNSLPNTLVTLKENQRDGTISLDDALLRREMTRIAEKFQSAGELNKKLHTISENVRLLGNTPTPKYLLSGLGHRFLEACT